VCGKGKLILLLEYVDVTLKESRGADLSTLSAQYNYLCARRLNSRKHTPPHLLSREPEYKAHPL
jgi:hypothetical protein